MACFMTYPYHNTDFHLIEKSKQINLKQLKTTNKMKKVTIILTGVILMTIASLNVNAQGTSATDDAIATARIITPITLTNTQGLAFGNIAASSSLGTVTISTAGVRSSAGGVTPSAIGTYNNAIYAATGEANATYSISLPASTTITDGTNNMTVNGFTSDPTPTGLLNGSGLQTINVGATLNVNANQVAGNYSGTYNVTIAYN
jgi:hypothetical protein